MQSFNRWISFGILGLLAALSVPARAGYWEFGLSASFDRSNYSETTYSWSRTLGTSLGYYFLGSSGFEVGYSDMLKVQKLENNTNYRYYDRVISGNWVQGFTGERAPVKPYVKLGFGQLIRDITGNSNGVLIDQQVDSITVILGAGIKVFFLGRFGVRFEAVSYLTGGAVSTWDDNFSVHGGLSIYF